MGGRAAAVRDGALHGHLSDRLPQADGSRGRTAGRTVAVHSVAARERRTTRTTRTTRTIVMFNSTFDAIVPMLCVTLAALAAMGAEAFRARDERMPIGGLGIVG